MRRVLYVFSYLAPGFSDPLYSLYFLPMVWGLFLLPHAWELSFLIILSHFNNIVRLMTYPFSLGPIWFVLFLHPLPESFPICPEFCRPYPLFHWIPYGLLSSSISLGCPPYWYFQSVGFRILFLGTPWWLLFSYPSLSFFHGSLGYSHYSYYSHFIYTFIMFF